MFCPLGKKVYGALGEGCSIKQGPWPTVFRVWLMGKGDGDLALGPNSARHRGSLCFNGVGQMQTQGLLSDWQDGLYGPPVPFQPQ